MLFQQGVSTGLHTINLIAHVVEIGWNRIPVIVHYGIDFFPAGFPSPIGTT